MKREGFLKFYFIVYITFYLFYKKFILQKNVKNIFSVFLKSKGITKVDYLASIYTFYKWKNEVGKKCTVCPWGNHFKNTKIPTFVGKMYDLYKKQQQKTKNKMYCLSMKQPFQKHHLNHFKNIISKTPFKSFQKTQFKSFQKHHLNHFKNIISKIPFKSFQKHNLNHFKTSFQKHHLNHYKNTI